MASHRWLLGSARIQQGFTLALQLDPSNGNRERQTQRRTEGGPHDLLPLYIALMAQQSDADLKMTDLFTARALLVLEQAPVACIANLETMSSAPV
jgi:hypothetical protein